MSDEIVSIAWDTIQRPWVDYQGNQDYSASAQLVMDACAAARSDAGRLPTLAELRRITKLSDAEIAAACRNLDAMGWRSYAAIGAVLSPAAPPPVVRPRATKAPIPSDLRWEIWQRDNFTCQECGARSNLSIDHIIPESRGGEMSFANLRTLCKRCNSRKGARLDSTLGAEPCAWWVYPVPPTDFWLGWLTPDEIARHVDPETAVEIEALQDAAFRATNLSLSQLRRGDEVHFCPLPVGSCESKWLFAFKEDNNGTTHIVSPRPLPHLLSEVVQ